MENLGAVLSQATDLLQAGRHGEAEKVLESAGTADAENPQLLFLLGAARHRQGRLEAALSAFDRATAMDPRHIQTLNAKGMMLALLERPKAALSAYQQALAVDPGDPQTLTNVGIALEQQSDWTAALSYYEQALARDPDFLPALMNRGVVLTRLGRLQEALENNDRLAATHPTSAEAHFNRAEVLLALDRPQQALAACDQAIELDPRHVKARIDRGLALSVLGRLEAALQEFEAARAIDPREFQSFRNIVEPDPSVLVANLDPRLIYLDRLNDRQKICDWSRRREFIENFERLIRAGASWQEGLRDENLPFVALSLPIGQETRSHLARNVAAAVSGRKAREHFPPLLYKPRADGKIRIAYLSPDFRAHPTAYLTRRLYALHDRGRFEVYAYSLHPGDGSEVRQAIRDACDVFREVSHLSAREIASFIHFDQIDILIDFAGYTNFSRSEVFANRPAPVQVSYLVYAGTTGADYMHYFIADRVVCPKGSEKFWVEKLVYLPDTYYLTNNREHAEGTPLSREALGLPADGFVFCCFNNPYKIDPTVFDVWMRVLGRVPGSVLWLLTDNNAVKRNLRAEAELRGIKAERIVFAPFWPHEKHLARYRAAGLFLDTLHYNAHTTAVDALWMDVPVITLPGESMPSRVAASLLRAVGLPELIMEDLEEYEETAVKLATDVEALNQRQSRLAANRAPYPLFATERRVLELEWAYAAMWDRCRAGLPPTSFEVPRISGDPEF